MSEIKTYKKLIEVALPLDDINNASAYEKLPGIGAHPRGIHHWWARRPFGAARAIIFAQMVNDPYETTKGDKRTKAVKEQIELERENLFNIIRDLSDWKKSDNQEVLNKAITEIVKSWRITCELNQNHPQAKVLFDPEKLPAFHDPFAGGGAIPLEAQRLGLESYASDLNPIPVMINKAMIEIPPKFVDHIPIGPIPTDEKKNPKLYNDYSGAKGLSIDVRRYGIYLHNLVQKEISNLYPTVNISNDILFKRPDLEKYRGKNLNVVAWIWARTVKSPNPICSNIDVPLIKSYVLSNKKNKEVWLNPIINNENNSYTFEIKNGPVPDEMKDGTKLGRGANFKCILTDTIIDQKYIKNEFKKNRNSQKLICIVCEGKREKVYIEADNGHENIAKSVINHEKINLSISGTSQYIGTLPYGMDNFNKLFTDRQLFALNTFVEKLANLKDKIIDDFIKTNNSHEKNTYQIAEDFSNAIITYLSFTIDRTADFNNTLTGWRSGNEKIMGMYNRQAISMTWDFGEANILEKVVGGYLTNLDYQVKCIAQVPANKQGYSIQSDAKTQSISVNKVISTDPPYYDNIPYADLSDFFYIWMRKTLKNIYPELFNTMAVPKSDELVAFAYRHDNDRDTASNFFMTGMSEAMKNMSEVSHPAFPVTIYYAFKQSDTQEHGTSSNGWETFLEAVINSGFKVTGTWPMRSEQSTRIRSIGANALASSVVLVCKKREIDAKTISRREFQKELKDEMPDALEAMIGGTNGASPIVPVDLAQAAIGPGMGIYSKYKEVLNQNGSVMSIHDALIMINKAVDEYFGDAEGELDEDTRFAIDWFMQYGFSNGTFGEADTLSRAKGTSVDLVKDAGIIESGQGKVKLLKWEEYPIDWDPTKDNRTPVWEATHHMIRVLNKKGENDAGNLLGKMPQRTEPIRQLAYRLYTLCERKGWAEEARAYNELIGSWHSIVEASYASGARMKEQGTLDLY